MSLLIVVTEEDVPSRLQPGATYKRRVLIGTCCRTSFELRNFTNTCPDCGTDFNSAGQRLAPRAQWGEETGEHPSECV